MSILYFDCFSGISGDMIIGALIDAGADPLFLEQELKKLGIEAEYELSCKTVVKNGISGTKFDVILKENHHHEHHHHHSHRGYTSIVQMIREAGFEKPVEEMALNIFKKIGESESKIHHIPLDDVHFHEVGAVDSIIDIVGTAILLHHLDIKHIYSSPIPVGSGTIHIDHGCYPVPAPATLDMLKGVPLAESNIRAELTTPTGAGVITVLSTDFSPLPAMTVDSIGYGAGTKDFPSQPNVLRVIIGHQ